MTTQRTVGTRRERALATRRRMLASAHALFRVRGYAGTTIEAIAKEAGVAVQTMYFTFRTKAALLEEVVDAAVVGFDHWVPPNGPIVLGDVGVLRKYHRWFEPFEATKTAQEALQVFIDGGVDIMERAAPLVATIREAAGDPDAKYVYELGEARRADAYEAVIRILAKKPPGLRRGVTVKRATDIVLTVFSGEVYQTLCDRGWKQREIRAWLIDVLGHGVIALAQAR